MQTYGQQIEQGTDVYGSDGEKIGSVAAVEGSYFIIEKGFIFTTDIYVPTSAIARTDDDGVTLSMTKDQVENAGWNDAPTNDDAGATDATYTEDRADYADSTYATDATAGTTGTAGAYDTETTDTDRLQRSEERLVVDKDVEQAGSVHVGKHVVEERQAVDVPVTREEVTIERHAVDRPASGDVFTDQAIDVPVYEERVETGKEARVVEELEVGKTARTETAHVEDTVRREEFDVDTSGDEWTGDRDRTGR